MQRHQHQRHGPHVLVNFEGVWTACQPVWHGDTAVFGDNLQRDLLPTQGTWSDLEACGLRGSLEETQTVRRAFAQTCIGGGRMHCNLGAADINVIVACMYRINDISRGGQQDGSDEDRGSHRE